MRLSEVAAIMYQSNPRTPIPRAFDERLAPYGGEFVEKMLARGNKLKDYVEKAEATRLRKR